MALEQYAALSNITLTSASSSVTFSSIPQNYRDLMLVVNGTASANQYLAIRLNSDSGSNYYFVRMAGPGGASSVTSATGNETFGRIGVGNPANLFNVVTQFMDYYATNKHKTWLSRSGTAGDYVGAIAGRWASTSAVTSMTVLTTTSDTWTAGTTFSLYGVR